MRTPRRASRLPALAVVVAAAAGGLVPVSDARADRPTAEMRDRVEEAFVDGRIGELEQLAEPGEEPVSVEPVAVRDLLWRPVAGPPGWRSPRPEVDATSVSARRLAWLASYATARSRGEPYSGGPYPAPAAGEDDPYPRITAWVRDRLHREGAGTTALDGDGPLGELKGGEHATYWTAYWVQTFRRPGIAGPGTYAPDEATLARRKAVREGVARARALGIAAVGFWSLVGGLLLLLRGSRVKPPPPPTDA